MDLLKKRGDSVITISYRTMLKLLLSCSLFYMTLAFPENKAQNRHKRNAAISTDLQSFFSEVHIFKALDIVFLLERSSAASKDNFEQKQLPLVKKIIRDYLYIAPGFDYTHVAVISYAHDISVDIDGIREDLASSNRLTKCDLVDSDQPWYNVKYNETSSNGVSIKSAIREAKAILSHGRRIRNHARSHIFVLSSGVFDDNELNDLQAEYNDWFYAYMVGVTQWADVRRLAIGMGTTAVYGSIENWDVAMRQAVGQYHSQVGKPPLWLAYSGSACTCSSGCHCDIITGFTRCLCDRTRGQPQGYLDQFNHCRGPCDTAPCPNQLYECQAISDLQYSCRCRGNIGNRPCDPTVIDECRSQPCQNNGQCVDGINSHACICTPGYNGRLCDKPVSVVTFNKKCQTDSCPGDYFCLQGLRDFTCIPQLIPNPVTTTVPPRPNPVPTYPRPIPPRTTPYPYTPYPTRNPNLPQSKTPFIWKGFKSSTTGKPKSNTDSVVVDVEANQGGEDHFLDSLSNDQRLMLIILPSAGVAFLILIMGIGGLIYVLCKGKGTRNKHDKNSDSGLTETTSIGSGKSHNPSLMTFDSKCYKDEGTPGAPKAKLSKEEENKITYGNFEDVLYDNEAIQRGMEEWYAYVLELYHNHGLNRILIVRLDGEKWVMSPGTKLHMDEVETTYKLLSKTVLQGSFKIQGREFGIVGNDDFVIMAHTFRNTKMEQEIACAAKTRQFVIIATAFFESDGGRCREKVVSLRDHIKKQGL